METIIPNEFVPKGNIQLPRSPTDFVKGIFSSIPYVVRNETGNWTPYLPTYEPQRYKFDTCECWCLSGINSIETQCNFLMATNRFPESTIQWFKSNGYIDSFGSFAFSERFIYILSGVFNNGNDQWSFWKLVNKYGLLPRADLEYSLSESLKFNSEDDMCKDYGDVSKVTPAMRQKALQCLKYINIAYEWVGEDGIMPQIQDIKATLLQAPLQIGIPVCMDTYNTAAVSYCGITEVTHAVLLYNLGNDNFPFDFRDQYMPDNKALSTDYFIPCVTNGVVSPIITMEDIPNVAPYPMTLFAKIWSAVHDWFVRNY